MSNARGSIHASCSTPIKLHLYACTQRSHQHSCSNTHDPGIAVRPHPLAAVESLPHARSSTCRSALVRPRGLRHLPVLRRPRRARLELQGPTLTTPAHHATQRTRLRTRAGAHTHTHTHAYAHNHSPLVAPPKCKFILYVCCIVFLRQSTSLFALFFFTFHRRPVDTATKLAEVEAKIGAPSFATRKGPREVRWTLSSLSSLSSFSSLCVFSPLPTLVALFTLFTLFTVCVSPSTPHSRRSLYESFALSVDVTVALPRPPHDVCLWM
jgi:hypothetical protein